jgi:hypothetical protein
VRFFLHLDPEDGSRHGAKDLEPVDRSVYFHNTDSDPQAVETDCTELAGCIEPLDSLVTDPDCQGVRPREKRP